MVGGFFENMMEGYREQFIHSQSGHIQVNLHGYFKKGASAPLDYLMPNAEKVRRDIEAQAHVAFTVPRLKFGGLASTDSASIAVLAVGTDALAERKMGTAKAGNADHASTNIVEGKDLDPSDTHGVLLGKGLAQALGVKPGDRVTFLTTRQAGASSRPSPRISTITQ